MAETVKHNGERAQARQPLSFFFFENPIFILGEKIEFKKQKISLKSLLFLRPWG
jgi:hypothetical protein